MDVAATTLSYSPPMGEVRWSGRWGDERPQPPIAVPLDLRSYDSSAATNEYADGGFDHHFAKLRLLAMDSSLWPEGADAPSEEAQIWARTMLRILLSEMLAPARVVASAEGGVAICFVNGDKYADVEFLNTGEILGVVSNRRDRPVAWTIEQSSRELARAVARIRDFIYSSQAHKNAPKWPWYRRWLPARASTI